MKEQWKTLIYNFEKYENYEISNFGKIRNKSTNHILGIGLQKASEKKSRTPYLYSTIGLGKKGLVKIIILHRAVAETFIENPNSYKYVIAKDNNYQNICLENLYWSSHRKGDDNYLSKKIEKNSNSKQVSDRRRKLKEMSVEYKGGKCVICGYDRCIAALEFHHLNPEEKDFSIASTGTTKSWERIKNELDKCICVCANCHREIHNDYISLNDFELIS